MCAPRVLWSWKCAGAADAHITQVAADKPQAAEVGRAASGEKQNHGVLGLEARAGGVDVLNRETEEARPANRRLRVVEGST